MLTANADVCNAAATEAEATVAVMEYARVAVFPGAASKLPGATLKRRLAVHVKEQLETDAEF